MKKLLLLFVALCCTAMMQAEIVHHAKCDPTYTTVGYTQECWEDTGTGKLYAEASCTNELHPARVVIYKKLLRNPIISENHEVYESVEKDGCVFNWAAETNLPGSTTVTFEFKVYGEDVANARIRWWQDADYYEPPGMSMGGGIPDRYITIKVNDNVIYDYEIRTRYSNIKSGSYPSLEVFPLTNLQRNDIVSVKMSNYGAPESVFAASLEYTSSNGGDPDAAIIKTDDKRKFKGADDPELTYSVTPASLVENVSGINVSRDAGEEPGFYTIHASLAEGTNPDREFFFYDGTFEIVDGVHHEKGDKYTSGLIYLQDCWEETATGKYYADDYLEHEIGAGIYAVVGYPEKLKENPVTATDGFTVKESATYDGVPFNWVAETQYADYNTTGTRSVEFTAIEFGISSARLKWYIDHGEVEYGPFTVTVYVNNNPVECYTQNNGESLTGFHAVSLPGLKRGDIVKFEVQRPQRADWAGAPLLAACLEYMILHELYFMAQEAGSTVQLKKNGTPYDASLEYSTTGTTWQPYMYGQTITLANEGDRVYFRNASDDLAEGFSKGYMSDYYQFAMTGSIAAGGNVMSLLDKTCKSTAFPDDDGNVETPEDFYYFVNLFSGCTSLTSAPELPATKLTPYCYMSMFNGCTGLTEAPALPATTLSDWCYNVMFEGCTGLEQAPALPATTMESNCYAAMFKGCTGLTEAPELPAMTMKDGCYYEMFSGCTSLETAPALPSTTLALQCYKKMFEGCTSLTAAPELPATTLAKECYGNMFNGCTSLTAAPELSATILAPFCFEKMFYGCTKLNQVKVGFTNWGDMGDSYAGDYRATSDWLSGVASTGIFVCPDALDKTKIGTSYIPEGWSVNGYNITVSSVGWASMYLPMAVTIPEGVKAYYAASVSDNVVTLNALTDAIPACTGVIVKAAAGTVTFPYTATAVTPIEGNLFEGVTCATPCDANANYVLAPTSTPDMPWFSNYTGTSLGAFKAYMPKSAVGGTGSIQFRFGDTTAITPAETEVAEDVVYNLAGQRVSSDYRGIVIKNGKKMLNN